MKKRITYKSRQTVRLKMRTVFVVFSIISGLMVGGAIFVFQLFENETSMAGSDPMVVSNIEIIQDTLPVLRGTSMQMVLGIRVNTKGKTQHLTFSGMEVAARGTSKPVTSFVSNARLWSTGNNDIFIPSQQIGLTLAEIPEDNFKLTGKQKLLEGDNFFWITFDVNQVPGSRMSQIDAECISVQIGTLTHEPDISAPAGSKRIQNNMPYYSTGNGDISSLDSWNSSRDGSGKRPTNFNQSNATFHIQSGHILRNDLNACLTYLLVERNGVLLSASGIKSDHVEIRGGGTIVQEKAILNPGNTELFLIKNGGNYIHRNTGRLPGKVRQFESYSNVVLNEYGPETFSEQIDWGNLIIDAGKSPKTEILNCFKTIKGNLEIRSTGNENFLYSSVDDTINIGGDLVINGGSLILAPATDKIVLNVSNDFILKSGSFSDAVPGKSPKGHLEFYPGKKVYLKAGEFRMTGKASFIHFQEEYAAWVQDTARIILPDIMVMPGCTLKLAGNTLGLIPENRSFTISSAAMVDCGTAIITGKGAFRLEPHGSIATANVQGIHSNTDSGSIQTKSRFYSSAGDYSFTGTCTPQNSGIFTTLPHANTVNQITINKTHPTGILILEQDLNVTGRLVKERGSINKNSHKLETGEQVTAKATP